MKIEFERNARPPASGGTEKNSQPSSMDPVPAENCEPDSKRIKLTEQHDEKLPEEEEEEHEESEEEEVSERDPTETYVVPVKVVPIVYERKWTEVLPKPEDDVEMLKVDWTTASITWKVKEHQNRHIHKMQKRRKRCLHDRYQGCIWTSCYPYTRA